MISAFTFRIPKALLVLLIPVNLVLIVITLFYMTGRLHEGKQMINNGIESLGNNFNQFQWNKEGEEMDISSNENFEKNGFQIAPGNVRFQFINPKDKQGSAEDILKQNNERYDEIMKRSINEPKDADIEQLRPPKESEIEKYQHAKATIIALVRNSEAATISKTIKRFEQRFNSKFRYPYTFINDQPFTDRFKEKMRTLSKAPMNFVVIPSELWDKPSSIDLQKQNEAMQALADQNIGYAKMESYHNMCRFYLGTFYKMPELQKYKYYWRIEPDVEFFTDVNYDVFKYLEVTKKVYGFTINLYDTARTVPTLWPETLKFLNEGDNYKYVNPKGAFQWLVDGQQHPRKKEAANGYSCCHFWSNFEIADLDFYRSEAYDKWFQHLDSTGKFYYERWGDAPVHSVGVGLFADASKVHWFRDIGYGHMPYKNCPNKEGAECPIGQFTHAENIKDQNCMMSWIDYAMEDVDAIY